MDRKPAVAAAALDPVPATQGLILGTLVWSVLELEKKVIFFEISVSEIHSDHTFFMKYDFFVTFTGLDSGLHIYANVFDFDVMNI